jgi:hypothetical protein
MKVDGSLWNGLTGQSLNFSFTATTVAGSVQGTVCASDTTGAVWCWGSNTNGALGIGSATPSSSTTPMQVQTATGLLSGIQKVWFSVASTTGCATDGSGDLWCWGAGANGQLGNGYTNNSLFAVPVVTSASGTQLTGVMDVAIAADHACALESDGTVWCWGQNANGEIGQGTTTGSDLYPTQVMGLPGTAVSVSAGVNTADNYDNQSWSCAVITNGSVWCWGGAFAGPSGVPVQAQTTPGDAGTPFGGAAIVFSSDDGTEYASRATDRSIWYWGFDVSDVVVPATQLGAPLVDIFQVCADPGDPSGATGTLTFIDRKGAFNANSAPVATQISCP